MVVEMLSFDVDPQVRGAWLEADARVWTAFLETCDGFVRKEVWVDADDEGAPVRVVIWWGSMAQWKAVGPEAVAEADARMGDLAVEPTCRAFEVVAQS
ncbi:MAG: TIGR03792 family protein [Actinomycetota bacterium]